MGFALSDMILTCSAFEQGGSIPAKHTGDAEDVSPALAWSNAPDGTQAFAIICHDPDAPLVVVEYSDLQCPSCQRHALETQPAIDESFVDTGQVMWVFKHFPLSVHPQSPAAAAAAECAGDQGRFFEMERILLETQEEWSVDDPDPVLLRLADELGLNAGDFSSCLSSRAALQRVLTDLFDGSGLVASTPTFFVIQGGQGARFEGARDAEDFVAILEGQLESALAAESEATDG